MQQSSHKGPCHRAKCAPSLLLATLLLAAWNPTYSQPAVQFVPAGLPSSNVTARLVYRMEGFVANWKDPSVRANYVAGRIVLDPSFWRGQFASTGGVAILGAQNGSDGVFTVTSGNTSEETSRPEVNFSHMPNAVLVEGGGKLMFDNVLIADIAEISSYQYSVNQPYINQGTGFALWPSIALAPNATVGLSNVSVSYVNPNEGKDTCEQYNSKVVFALRQAFGADAVVRVNATAVDILGPVNITVLVRNGSDNSVVGNATAMYNNVTFGCKAKPAASSGLSPGALAAAIVVPVVVVALLAATGLLFCTRRRRRRLHEAGAGSMKDVESGSLQYRQSADGFPGRDQFYGFPQGAASHTSSRTPSIVHSSASTLRGLCGLGSSDNMPVQGRHPQAAVGSSSADDVLTPAGSSPLPLVPSSSHSQGPSQGQTNSGGASWATSPSPQSSSVPQRLSVDTTIAAAVAARHPVGQSYVSGSSSAGTDSSSLGPLGPGGALVGSGSGGRGSGSTGEPGGSGGRVGSTADRFSSVSALLKARSDVAVLRELKIGPLLGRGSYGRVYRGRWKATTVAVKIIEHMAGAPGTASSGGKRMSVGRESMLATSISHPNVVQTYHISTMTVSERNALASAWISESGSGSSGASKSPNQSPAPVEDETSSNESHSNHSSMESQRDMLETWMIMEFCEKGSMERAINQGRFIRRSDKKPEMVGILKALLDTASGLDYLHSIGVVHGDLKTANVLLKGSTRDARGFMCKITDFGLSRVLDMDATHISTNTYGTIVYMPKELLLTGRMTQTTDIYSLALMMWELYTSTRVFDEGLSVGQMFYMIAYQNWRPEVPPDCPPGYAELMQACWHEDPQQRPTAQQVLRQLQKLYVEAKQQLAANRQAEAETAGIAAAATATQLNSQGSRLRASHESDVSDRYRSAAAAATEAAGRIRPKEGTAGTTDSNRSSSSSTAHARVTDSGSQIPGSGGGGGPGSSEARAGAGGSASSAEAENYKPYAAAVLQRRNSGSLPVGSSSTGYVSAGGRSNAGHGRQQQPQQDAASHSGRGAESSIRQQYVQQRPTHGINAAAGATAKQSSIGSGGLGSSEIEVFDDPIPSESLFFNNTEESNAEYGGEDDGVLEFSGYLARPEQQQTARQVSPHPIELPIKPANVAAAVSAAAAVAALPIAAPTEAVLQQRAAAAGAGVPDDNLGAADRSLSFRDSFRDSISTGTLPSVLGDSFVGSSALSLGPTMSSLTAGRFSSMAFSSAGAPAGAPASPSTHSSLGGSDGSSRVSHPGAAIAPASPGGVFPSPSSGTLQTVHEGSGALDGGNSPTAVSPASSPNASGDMKQQAAATAQLPAPPAPAPSPFAALAQRAGSLFGPLKT